MRGEERETGWVLCFTPGPWDKAPPAPLRERFGRFFFGGGGVAASDGWGELGLEDGSQVQSKGGDIFLWCLLAPRATLQSFLSHFLFISCELWPTYLSHSPPLSLALYLSLFTHFSFFFWKKYLNFLWVSPQARLKDMNTTAPLVSRQREGGRRGKRESNSCSLFHLHSPPPLQ